jgi:diacylglycerol kinase (ATP)
MLVVVNRYAGGGRAAQRWEQVHPLLNGCSEKWSMVMPPDVDAMRSAVVGALKSGETDFVAAGGDGTVNALLNLLITETAGNVGGLRLGAIGLGSSNDFHKPVVPTRLFAGCPVMLGFEEARPRDVGMCVASTPNGVLTRYFLLNGSLGVTARANEFFNHPDRLLNFLKRRSTMLAIGYAALRTVMDAACSVMTVESAGTGSMAANVTYAAIIKSPHVSGGLRFPVAASYDDGQFSVYLYSSLKRRSLVRLAIAMSRGREYRKGCATWSAASCSFASSQMFAVETDGEVFQAAEVRFSILPQLLKVCVC